MDMTITFVMNHPTFQSNSSKVVRQIFHDIWKKCSSGDTQGPINMNGVIIGRWDTAVGNLREKPNMVITFEIEGIKINADEIHRILDEIALEYESGKTDGTIFKERPIGLWRINS
jgi:hypothetical protein